MHVRAIVRESDTLARLGGDEFFVLARNIESAEAAVVLARRMIAAMGQSIPLRNGGTVALGASVGICLLPYPECNAHDIIRRADRAMYSVKRAGKSGYAFAN
jgi:diguanylate cyclase (GGDEF)-like protein